MAFQTDTTWTPSAYRKAYAHWAANAPANDGDLIPRDAHTTSPRHGKIAEKLLRPLRTWRAATNPDPALTTSWLRYDLRPDNDNYDDGAEPVPQLFDCVEEIRPSINEMRREYEPTVWKKADVEYRHGVAIGGDVAWGRVTGPTHAASDVSGEVAPKRTCRIVKRIRGLEFSNGRQVEKCTVLKLDKPVFGEVRMPVGALVRCNGRKPVDNFRGAKGSFPEARPTVGVGGRSPGAGACPDPFVDAEWAVTIRQMVGKDTARILDLALTAANFREIGVSHGKQGKTAERHGQKLVIEACEKLQKLVAANDHAPAIAAAA
jgi:hypothetical protein